MQSVGLQFKAFGFRVWGLGFGGGLGFGCVLSKQQKFSDEASGASNNPASPTLSVLHPSIL